MNPNIVRGTNENPWRYMKALITAVFLLFTFTTLSAGDLPFCIDREPPLSTAEIDLALTSNFANFDDHWGDDSAAFFAAVADDLNCQWMNWNEYQEVLDLLLESGFESSESTRTSFTKEQGDSRAIIVEPSCTVCVDDAQSAYCCKCQYCGRGDSCTTGGETRIPNPSEALNQACFEHDRCYGRQCLSGKCVFNSGHANTVACDQPLHDYCTQGGLSTWDRTICG